MMQTPNEHNPEFEMYRQVLLRERRSDYMRSWVQTIVGAGVALLLIGSFILSFQQIIARGSLILFVLLLCLVGSLGAFGLGLASLRTAAKRPTTREIARLRRYSRSRLLQQAQGKLPWRYRRSGRIVITLAGILFVGMASLVLSSFGVQTWDAWVEVAFGLLLIVYALVIIPIRRLQLPQESAEILTKTFVAGEVTEGPPVDQEGYQQ